MREFPYSYAAKKKIPVYPDGNISGRGDILEIGPGRGDFMLNMAKRCPEKTIVGIELGQKRYNKLIPRIEKHGLTNIILLGGDARIALPRYFSGHRFEMIYVLFPDPWPKRRHIPQRLMSIDFMTLLTSRLIDNGHLFVATDFWSYADWVVDNAEAVDGLKNTGHPFFIRRDEMPNYSQSYFEQKWRIEGRMIYYMRFEKSI